MSLVVDVQIADVYGGLVPIDQLVIRRLEPLTVPDAFYKYEASIPNQPLCNLATGTVTGHGGA